MTEAQFVFLLAFIACATHGIYTGLMHIFDRNGKAGFRTVVASIALGIDLCAAWCVMEIWEHLP
jgi:hypothetical protein